MSDHVTTDSRRGFLRRAGLTLAAGVGVATLGRVSSAEAAPAAKDAGTDGVNACAVYCYVYRCNDCASGRHIFRCVNNCDGATSYTCFTRSCAGFCLSANAC